MEVIDRLLLACHDEVDKAIQVARRGRKPIREMRVRMKPLAFRLPPVGR